MLTAVLHLAALALPVAHPDATATSLQPIVETPVTDEVPVVVVHGEDLALRDRLLRTIGVWHDAGEFLVAVASPRKIQWLDRQGIPNQRIGRYPVTSELFIQEIIDETTLRRIEGLGGKLLFRHDEQILIAMPPGGGDLLQHIGPEGQGHTHHGDVPIRQSAMTPARPFVPPSGMGGAAGMSVADPRIQASVDAVDVANVETTIAGLASIYSRRANLNGAVTAQGMLKTQMESYGISTTLQDFGYLSKNVIGEIPGIGDPSKIIVIGGHYDSINKGGSSQPAPGADDNASGTGGVLEAARVMAAGGPYLHTLRFIAFSGEELGLYGSSYAATLSDNLGEDIIAMINMDMIAYRAPGDARDVDLVTNGTSADLNSFCDSMGALYVPNWAVDYGSLSAGSSDHASYSFHGFPAAFFFEDIGQHFGGLHTAADSYPAATNDFELAEMIVKGVVASASSLAVPADMSITHTSLEDTQSPGPYSVDCQIASLTGSTIISATLSYSIDETNYTQVPMAHQGGGDWNAQIPDLGSPTTIYYYFDAFDDQGQSETLPAGMDFQTPPFYFFVGVKVLLYSNDFEGGDDGWTHYQINSQDDWQRGAPQGKVGDPTSAFSGNKIWGNDLGASGWNGEYQPNTTNWLTSPVFDFTHKTTVILEYQRWLGVEQAPHDLAEIRVNSKEVWQNVAGADHVDTAWTKHTLDISEWAAGKSWIQIQFHMISDGGVELGGWNIDDFALYTLSTCPVPTTYCTSSPNSSGEGAVIGSFGTASIVANDLTLTVDDATPHQFGLFYYGPNQISLPYGEGVRCVGGGIYRLGVVSLDTLGNGIHQLDITNPPEASAQIEVGDIWNFQCWYRDPAGGPSGFNFSDGLEVLFCP
jgi:hypothetical protein